jgi:ADP-ribose pyrophosphatase
VSREAGFGLVGRRQIVRTRFLSVERAYYTTPGGWAVREIVRHPGSVVVVPWDGERVHMIRQMRVAVGTPLLELPAGKLDVDGEPPEAAAARECAEEVGLQPGRLSLLHTAYTSPGFTDERCLIYLAEDLVRVGADPQGAEEAAAEHVALTPEEAAAGMADGSITDATTLIGLYALRHRLER